MSYIVNELDEMDTKVPPFFQRLEASLIVVQAVEDDGERAQDKPGDFYSRHDE